MGPIEKAIREKFFTVLFGGEGYQCLLSSHNGSSVKHGGLGITEPRLSAEIVYNTSKAASRELVDSLLGGSALNYIVHRECIRRASAGESRERRHVEMAELARKKGIAGGRPGEELPI